MSFSASQTPRSGAESGARCLADAQGLLTLRFDQSIGVIGLASPKLPETYFLAPEQVEQPNIPNYFYPPDFSIAEIADDAQLTSLSLPTTFRYGG